MDKIITSFVGLDVHKDSIAMGVASDWLHPAASRKLGFRLVVSRPQELPLQSLAEPCVRFSPHTAPSVRSGANQWRQCTNRCGSRRATRMSQRPLRRF